MDNSACGILNSDASENVVYNNREFPAYIKKGRLSSYPCYSALSHWHDDLEFILIQDGSMTYDVNGQSILLKEGEGIFVNSRCLHYGYSESHSECHFLCILLSLKLFAINDYIEKEYIQPLTESRIFPFQKLNPTITWQNQILHDLDELYQVNKDEIHPFEIIEKGAHLFRLLEENKDSSSQIAENSEDILALTMMIGYVQKNYADKILLMDIAKAGNCCKTKCTQLFQKYLNVSPMIYLNKYRLEKSTDLLRNTDLSMIEIAYSC